MVNNGKKMAFLMIRRVGNTQWNEADLCAEAEKNGYTVVRFSAFDDDSPEAELMRELRLTAYAAAHRGFTYADEHFRLIFVQSELAEQERRIVLAHELGHIVCGHLMRAGIIGSDVLEEHEANEFAHALLYPPRSLRTLLWLRSHLREVLAVLVVIATVIAATLVYRWEQSNVRETYYVTSAGTRYHRKDCIVIQGKTNVREATEEDLKSGFYTPCGVCHPDD